MWQGFSNRWGYNHRINRLGSLVDQSEGGCPRVDDDRLCDVRWANMAASGTGPDSATVRTYLALVAAPRVGFGAATGELVLSGDEGAPLEASGTVAVALDAYTAERPTHVALLNGFDLLALDSADKLVRFGLEVGAATVVDGVAHVPVHATGVFSCSSAECPPRDVVDYSLRVAVLVVGLSTEDVELGSHEVGVGYAWDDQVELLEDAAATELPRRRTQGADVVGYRRIAVTLDAEHHMLSMAADVADGSGALLFKNWRHRMRRERPPGSLTAFREPGEATWEATLTTLSFAEATVLPIVDEGRIRWPGWGRDANDPAAERKGSLLYAQRAGARVGLADHPIEVAGTRLEDARGRQGVFRPRRSWAKGGRRRDRLDAGCTGAPNALIGDGGSAAAALRQVSALSELLAEVGSASLTAPSTSVEDVASRVVLGGDVAPEGAAGGGLVFVRPDKKGWELVGEDWWVRRDDTDIVLRGRLGLAADGTIRWAGHVSWGAGSGPLGAVRGTLERDGAVLTAHLAAECGRQLDVRAELRDASDCATWDGSLVSASIRSSRDRYEVAFDEVCDGCAGPGAWCVEGG